MPRVHFVEFRQIRRNDRTIKWFAGETYDYDPDMEPMIKIGHARLVPDEPPAAAQPAAAEAAAEDAAPVRRRGGAAGPDGVVMPPEPEPAADA